MQISYRIQTVSGHSVHWNNKTPFYPRTKEELMNTILDMKYDSKINNTFIVTESYDEYNVIDGDVIMMFKVHPDDKKEFIYMT